MIIKFKIPKHWEIKTVQELASTEKQSIRIGPFGSALKKNELSDQGIRVLGIDHVIPNKLTWHKPKYIPELKYKELVNYTVGESDVLVTNMGTVGRVCVVPPNFPTAIISSHLIKVSPDLLVINPHYLSWVLNYCPIVVAQIKAKCHGAIMAGFNTTLLKSIQIPLPPLQEQKQIVAILDKADRVRRKRQEAIRLTEELGRSIFIDMFGDPISQGWKMVKVGDMAAKSKNSMRTGPFGSNLLHSEFVDEGIPVLGIDNAVKNRFLWAKPRFITPEKYKQLRNYTVYPEDVIITIMGTCGRCAIIPDDCPTAINTKHLCCITTNKEVCLPEFLHGYFLFHPIAKQYFERNTKGAIMDGLNQTIIKGLPIPLAPMELQHQYKKAIQKLNAIELKAKNHFSSSENLFNSLLQRAFRGEL